VIITNNPRSTDWTKLHTVVLLVVLLVGACSRVAYVDRPLDHRLLAPWREADYTQIARNFYRDGLNIFYPKIDWRGDTPGYAEMEFPLIPWVAAVSYRVFGYHEELLRVPAAILGILSLLVFSQLSRRALPPLGALFATATFALNPLLISLGNAMQPEPLMLLLSLLAIAWIWRWDDDPKFSTLLAAAVTIAAAILAKSPAAYLGLVLAYTLIRKLGIRAFTDRRTYAAAVLALLPPLAWYLWAWSFWRIYGNSLGVSNESHYIGLDMLFPPRFLYGLLKWETLGVFTPAGWLLALAAVRLPRRAERALVWYGAVWVLYLVTARTSGDDWAFYYHSNSIAPACLLMGAGLVAFVSGVALPRSLGWSERREGRLGGLMAAVLIVSLIGATGVLVRRRDVRDDYLEMRTCALEFLPYVPRAEMVVVDGGTMVDEYDHPVAHNASMVFAWMDRKGFNYGTQELGIQTLERIATRGGRYWIARRDELERDDLKEQVNARYRRIADCHDRYYLYDLRRQ
jgi:hypothetical protein